MDRLRDHLGDGDPDLAFAARLADAARCDLPTDAALDRLGGPDAARSRRAARPRLLQPAAALATLLGVASLALAAAYYGRHRATEPPAAPAPESSSTAASAPGPVPVVPTPPAEPTSAAAPSSPGTGPGAPSGAPSGTAASPPPTTSPAAVPRTRSRDAASVLRRDADIPVLVDALRALRRDHDPDRASLFFTYYLDRYPNGRFVEEALALSIEAADQLDAARAASLARRYLREYPKGAYRAAAERALRGHPANR